MTRPLLVAAFCGLLAGCTAERDEIAQEIAGGNVLRGRTAIRQYGCHTCHTIPGVTGAVAVVGPPLNGVGARMYLGGVVTNTPENMVAWLLNPKQFEPLTAMPVLGLKEQDARDIAAYLYTLP